MTLTGHTSLKATTSVLILCMACTAPDTGRKDRAAEGYLKIIAAEINRPTNGPDLEFLVKATSYRDVFLRQSAVRALGRLENPALINDLAHHIEDPQAAVRVEAVNALAQAVHRSDGAPVLGIFLARIGSEHDERVLGAFARSLGRLRLGEEDQGSALELLLSLGNLDPVQIPPKLAEGLALGLEALARRSGGELLSERAKGQLVKMLRYRSADEQTAARVRALALLTLRHAGVITARYVDESLRDPDPDARRVAAASLDLMPPALRTEFTRRALGDQSLRVSVEAIRQLANHPSDTLKCQWLNTALEETDIRPIKALALEALGEPCPDVSAQQRILMDAVSEIGVTNSTEWLAPARALVSLASIAPELAEAALPQFLEHENAFVRSYAATTAALLGQTDVLRVLSRDPIPNVRTAAIQFLAARDSESIDELLVSQLSTDDPQLLMTAARLLENSPLGLQAASATLLAFERVSASQRETSRDARRALLERVNEFGDATMTSRLEPFLRDFDPQVATDVASILERWSGQSRQPSPELLPRGDLPNPAELYELRHSEVILHMERGGEIVIRALPDVALTNAQRFVRLANEGYFDGLTFHRWEPGFVIQGGSPGANEYSGDGPYTRDEVDLLPHWRGTVGVSTRGHDTGDAQIFINLADNVRLNHDYTIFGVVVDGMEDVVDLVVEGDVITRAEVRVGT